MADTFRKLSALLALMPLATPGGVSAQDQRDQAVSQSPNRRYYRSITGTTTVDSDDDVVELSGTGTYTVTLPAAVSSLNFLITFKKTGASGTVTLDANGAELIDAATTYAMNTQWQKVTLFCNGTQWFILES